MKLSEKEEVVKYGVYTICHDEVTARELQRDILVRTGHRLFVRRIIGHREQKGEENPSKRYED